MLSKYYRYDFGREFQDKSGFMALSYNSNLNMNLIREFPDKGWDILSFIRFRYEFSERISR